MAEMIVVKCDIGSKAATVLCPNCARISRQILKQAFNNGSNNELLTAHTCPVCGSVYHVCNSFGADAWKSALSSFSLNPDAYNTLVKDNHNRRQQAAKDARKAQEQVPVQPANTQPVSSQSSPDRFQNTSGMNYSSVSEEDKKKTQESQIFGNDQFNEQKEDSIITDTYSDKRYDKNNIAENSNETVEQVNSTYEQGETVPPRTILDRKIDRWKKELLDTGKRNKMINYRETKRATLKILEPGATELFNQLAVSEKTLTFQRPISKDSDFRTYAMLSLLETLSYSLPVHVGDIKAEGTVMEREKTLKNLRSKTKLAQEEQGTNILYLSFGFILWREHNRDSSPWLKSPLLMMPVQLGLKSLNAPYTLSKYDDEIEVNPTLDYLFNQNYGIDLPTFELKNKDSFDNYMEQIEEIIDKKGWKLIREVSLGLLSFLKISMYHDLNNNREILMNNPVIQAISGDRHALGELPAQAKNFNFDKTQPTEWYEVVDSDSSQEEAILLSKLGVSFVMQGPPGTGKSQTITNIIAEALGDGKKVLFVSEKSAALQVVLKRLTDANLDDFCLSLHNYKANKKEIIDNIGSNLGLSWGYAESSIMWELTELFHDRQYLDEYAEELHKTIEPFGESPYTVFGRLAKYADATAINFKFQNPTQISKEKYASLLFLVDAFEKALNNIDGKLTDNPWADTTATVSGQLFKTEMINATEGLEKNLNEMEGLVLSLNDNYRCKLVPNWSNVSANIDKYESILELPLFPVEWKNSGRRSFLRIRALSESKKKDEVLNHVNILKELSDTLTESWSVYNLSVSQNELKQIMDIKEQDNLEDETLADCNSKVIDSIDKAESEIKELLGYYREAVALIGVSEKDTLSDILIVNRILDAMEKVSALDPSWFDMKKNAQYLSRAKEAKTHKETLLEKRNKILENWESAVLEINTEELLDRFKTKYTVDFHRTRNVFDNDLSRLRVMHKSVGIEIDDDEIIDMLQDLVAISKEKIWFTDNDARISEKYPSLYKGIETNWDDFLFNIQRLANDAIKHKEKIHQLKEEVLSGWERETLNLDSTAMLNKFKTDYVGMFHKMKSGYKEDMEQIRLLSKSVGTKIKESEVITLLQSLNEIKQEKQWFFDNETRYKEAIPTHYHAEDTDWELIKREINSISVEAQKHQNIIREKQRSILERWEPEALDINPENILRRFREDYTQNYRTINDLYKKDINYLMKFFKDENIQLSNNMAQEVLQLVNEIKEEQRWYQENENQLKETFIVNYAGFETDWDNVIAGIHTASDVVSQMSIDDISENNIYVILKAFENSDKASEMLSVKNSLSENRIMRLAETIKDVIHLAELPIKISLQSSILPRIEELKCSAEKIDGIIKVLDDSSRSEKVTWKRLKELMTLTSSMMGENTWIMSNTDQFKEENNTIDDDSSIKQLAFFASLVLRRYEGTSTYVQSEELKKIYGERYKGLETDWQQIISDIDAVDSYLKNDYSEGIEAFLDDVSNDAEKRKNAQEELVRLNELLKLSEGGIDYFDKLFPKLKMRDISFRNIADKYTACLNGFGELNKWLDYIETKRECDEEGLNDFTDKIAEKNNEVRDVRNAFERGFLMQWLSLTIDDVPSVQTFQRRVHEQKLDKFVKLDTKQFDFSKERIRDKIIGSFPDRNEITGSKSELRILLHEMEKKRRIMPLRKLFHEIPTLLLTLKPCLMMSPLSVAYFLNAEDYHFDMVIFDEASQIFPQDAIGAIFRADQVIIAGDTKQLPPTNFFSSSTSNSNDDYDDDNEDDFEEEVYDSILEETANVLPNRTLLWHYRSKHEHLIAFSNQEIYKNELVTFPSSNESEPDTGVEFSFVEGGYYDRGGKRNNILEAKRCVELVKEHIEKHPKRSLGIIAFSEAQQQTILNEIQKFREENPKYEEFFAEDREEEFFVKNLENVQGDERDTIFLSICYAKTKEQIANNKPMSMNFGPVMKAGGERRLNVAITRAKINVKLVASILPSDIDLNRTESEGIRMIRSYIEFAMNGGATLAAAHQSRVPDNFADAVYKFICDKGYKAKQYVGCSGYKIDIAVEHPEHEHEFVAGIECDGLSYRKAKTARDRDRLRGSVLKNMGWNLYRVWSTEWYRNPEVEGQKLIEFIEMAISKSSKRLKAIREEKETEERKQKTKVEKERMTEEREGKHREPEEQQISKVPNVKQGAEERQNKKDEELRHAMSMIRTAIKKQEEAKLKAQQEVKTNSNSLNYSAWAEPGAKVKHSFLGLGTIKEINDKYVTVGFESGEKTFAVPTAFERGFLKKDEHVNETVEESPVTKKVISETHPNLKSDRPAKVDKPKSDIYEELISLGFTCKDNRSSSAIIWVLYDSDKKEKLDSIMSKYNVAYRLEKRGSMATGGKAAWMIRT